MTTEVQAVDFNSFIFAQGEELKTTSLKIAEAFDKNHKDVLRVIDRIISQASDLFNQRNFAPVDYLDSKGESRRMYELTKDGFIMVVMSFTGEKAMQIKEAYINAFNFMRKQLTPKQYGLKELPPATLTTEMKRHIQELVNAEKNRTGRTHATIYHDLKTHFQVAAYSEIPISKYGKVCAWFGAEPKYTLPDMITVNANEIKALDKNDNPKTRVKIVGSPADEVVILSAEIVLKKQHVEQLLRSF